ncbi:MAG: nickel transporter [Hyphomicrobiaceae bacterium]
MKPVLLVMLLAMVALVAMTSQSGVAGAQTSTGQDATRSAGSQIEPKSMLAGRSEERAASGWYADSMRWLQRQQQGLNRMLTGGIRDLKSNGTVAALMLLVGLSFLYGVLHAAGPGHGKAVISSYAVASAETIRRSIALSFLAAFFQALSAIAIVGIMAIALRATGLEIQQWARRLEQVSFAAIALLGAWLLVAALRRHVWAPRVHATEDHHHEHHHGHHGHAHVPEPTSLAGPWSWRRAVALAAAVGVRPCSGAILLLVFALTQGIFWAGVAGTFAMALGTALTVAALAVMAVGTRKIAERAASDRLGRWIEAIAGIGGAALVLGLGTVLFLASLGPAPPF